MTLPEALAARLSGRVVVVGVGNPLRGDDAAGCLVASLLSGVAGVSALDAEEVPESYVGDIAALGPDTVVLVDAVDLGAEPGAVAVLERDHVAAYGPTTHRLPLSLVMDVVRERTGADVFLVGIQPADFAFGAAPSSQVLESVQSVARLLSRRPVESGEGPRPTRGSRPTGGAPA